MILKVDVSDRIHLGLEFALPQWDARVLGRYTVGHGLASTGVGTLSIPLTLLKHSHAMHHGPHDTLLSTKF